MSTSRPIARGCFIACPLFHNPPQNREPSNYSLYNHPTAKKTSPARIFFPKHALNFHLSATDIEGQRFLLLRSTQPESSPYPCYIQRNSVASPNPLRVYRRGFAPARPLRLSTIPIATLTESLTPPPIRHFVADTTSALRVISVTVTKPLAALQNRGFRYHPRSPSAHADPAAMPLTAEFRSMVQ